MADRTVDERATSPIDGLARLDRETARLLRGRLAVAAEPGALDAPVAAAPGVPDRLVRVVARSILRRRGDDRATLALAFGHGGADAAAFKGVLGDDLVSRLDALGIVEERSGVVRGRFRLVFFHGAWILADPPHAGQDAVMAPGSTTEQVVRVLPDVNGRRTVDVGTGPGTMAIVMALRGATAIGTDINPRALAMARANAVLNDVRIDFRDGPLLEPVRDERWDLIVSQLPYVLQPETVAPVQFLHGGAYGDELPMRLVADAPRHLGRDGIAVSLFDSPVRKDRTLKERIVDAGGARGVDLLVVDTPGVPVHYQAMSYAQLADPALSEGIESVIVAYEEHAHRLGIERVSHSLGVQHRSGRDRTWAHALGVPTYPATWEEVASYMRGIDLLGADDATVLGASVKPRPGATLEHRISLDEPSREPFRTVEFDAGSIAASSALAEAGWHLLEQLAWDPSVARAVDELARATGHDRPQAEAIVLQFVREALARGFLVTD